MSLTPEIIGAVEIQSSAQAFAQAFTQRVAAGLLTGHPHPRSNYRVVEAGADRLKIEAADWWTAINVGLNEVELWFPHTGSVRYRVRYWRWTWYSVALCALLGLAGLVLLVGFDARGLHRVTPERAGPRPFDRSEPHGRLDDGPFLGLRLAVAAHRDAQASAAAVAHASDRGRGRAITGSSPLAGRDWRLKTATTVVMRRPRLRWCPAARTPSWDPPSSPR